MNSHPFGDDLARAAPRQTVILSGYPEGDETEWHVNKAVQIGGTPDGRTKAVVLQARDGSEHWVVAILDETDEGWRVDKLSAFEGEKPQGLDAEAHGDRLDPTSISVVEILD